MQLVELSQGMSAAMSLVYESLAELMDACVRELRKTNKLDTSDLTVEQVRGGLCVVWAGGRGSAFWVGGWVLGGCAG